MAKIWGSHLTTCPSPWNSSTGSLKTGAIAETVSTAVLEILNAKIDD